MRKQEVIDELALLVDCIENTVEEMNKNQGKKNCQELVLELVASLCDSKETLERYLTTIKA